MVAVHGAYCYHHLDPEVQNLAEVQVVVQRKVPPEIRFGELQDEEELFDVFDVFSIW